jgi:hypothetical protein
LSSRNLTACPRCPIPMTCCCASMPRRVIVSSALSGLQPGCGLGPSAR